MPGFVPVDPIPTLSIVVPLLNEEAVLDTTYQRLTVRTAGAGRTYEIIFVDDGSTDRSRAILTMLSQRDPAVRVVSLSRNFGHEMATTAGLHHARGRAAIVMDADLQDPPELIARVRRANGARVIRSSMASASSARAKRSLKRARPSSSIG